MLTADTEEVALHFEHTDLNSNSNLVKTHRLRHPIALIFHMLFRTLAILLFLFANLFFSNFITIFVILICCLSMDFWTVKNISGRLLVGLRWWNQVDEDGKSNWIFENRKNGQSNNNMSVIESTTEATIFWGSLIAADIIWAVFFMVSLLTFNFKWMTIIIVALMLNLSNTYGFLKCKYGSESDMQSAATSFFGKQMFKSMLSKVTTSGTQNQTASGANN